LSLRRAACLALLAGALAGCSPGPAAPARPTRPNVVLILADDLGTADVGAYGGRVARTPQLDALAAAGVRFTQGYVSVPLCAPARAALLTGRDHNRYGYEATGTYLDDLRKHTGLALSEVLLPELLHDAGYATGIFGKWHLGPGEEHQPLARGFDVFFGILSGAHDYFDWKPGVWGPVLRGREKLRSDGYLTEAITSEAVAFIEASAGRQPFFAYVPYTAIHAPFEAPPELVASYADVADERLRLLAAMTTALDTGVGRILEALERVGAADETLVIFLSDNGSIERRSGPLRGSKATLLEGGIRVPFLMRWPGVLRAGTTYAEPVSSLDLFPTILAAAGVAAPPRPLDGVDLLPYLGGARRGPPHPRLFWQLGDQWAVREGPFKLVHSQAFWNDPGMSSGLYDLEADPGETRDLSAEQPGRVEALTRAIGAWRAGL
jgi:arylsulfatase A-like enzyme